MFNVPVYYKNIKKYIKKKFTLQTPSILPYARNDLYKNHRNCKTEKFSFGEKNPDLVFYVIKRTPGTGFFSNILFVINHIIKANKNGYIPVVDMENFPTIYNEYNEIFKTKNSWEYYFENLSSINLEEVYKSKNVIISSNNFENEFELDLISNEIKYEFKKNLKIKKKFTNIIDYLSKKYFDGSKVLGIHFRGTSYKRSPGHPFPATKKQMLNAINHLLTNEKYDKIFLVTEEEYYKNFLEKKFKGKIFYLSSSFRSYKNDAFTIYHRKNHRYKLGREALIEANLLSRCDGLVYVTSNITSAAIAWNYNKSQKRYLINNGFNSKNIISSQFLWYLKKVMPKNFGGFKNLF